MCVVVVVFSGNIKLTAEPIVLCVSEGGSKAVLLGGIVRRFGSPVSAAGSWRIVAGLRSPIAVSRSIVDRFGGTITVTRSIVRGLRSSIGV